MAKRAEPVAAARRSAVARFRARISAESRAAAFLVAKGFRILSRRWNSPLGELDIVARRRKLLIFVEVKARDTLDAAAYSIDDAPQRRIAAAAEAWLATYPAAQCHRYAL